MRAKSVGAALFALSLVSLPACRSSNRHPSKPESEREAAKPDPVEITEIHATVFLTNSDRVTGRMLTPSFTVDTAFATLTFNTENIKTIRLRERVGCDGEERAVERIELTNNDTFTGIIAPEEVMLCLDAGETVEFSKDLIHSISLRVVKIKK